MISKTKLTRRNEDINNSEDSSVVYVPTDANSPVVAYVLSVLDQIQRDTNKNITRETEAAKHSKMMFHVDQLQMLSKENIQNKSEELLTSQTISEESKIHLILNELENDTPNFTVLVIKVLNSMSTAA